MNLISSFISLRICKLGRLTPLIIAVLVYGCSQRDEPEVDISWLAPQTRAAQSADCSIPMLKQLPNTDYQQIALIEVVDDYNADDAEVEGLARRKACETGADALVILENQKQKSGADYVPPGAGGTAHKDEHAPDIGEVGHKGRVLNAVAIVYQAEKSGKNKTTPSSTD